MNKIIARIFGELLTVVHIIFITLIFGLLNNKSSLSQYIPDIFLQNGNINVFVIVLIVFYIFVMGTVCTLIAINTYLREIRDSLVQLNQTQNYILNK